MFQVSVLRYHGLSCTVPGFRSISFFSYPSASGRVATKLATILQRYLRRVGFQSTNISSAETPTSVYVRNRSHSLQFSFPNVSFFFLFFRYRSEHWWFVRTSAPISTSSGRFGTTPNSCHINLVPRVTGWTVNPFKSRGLQLPPMTWQSPGSLIGGW